MNLVKVFRLFLKPTSEEKIPTNLQLDYEIAYVSELLHHLSPLLKKIIYTKIKLFFLYRWKYLLSRIIVIGTIITLSFWVLSLTTNIHITTQSTIHDTIIKMYPNDTSMNLRNFLLQIAYIESRYNKNARRDSSQFLGLYQLGTEARRIAGYGDVPINVFLNHPEIQDLAMINLLKHNRKCMKKYIEKYSGKIIDGILITESGILALSHLGCEFAKKCLDNGIIPEKDVNGNTPRAYAKLGGYQLNLDKVKYSIEDGN